MLRCAALPCAPAPRLPCRGLRHLEIARLRCDIKDFEPAGVPGLEGCAAPWVALGKHLCGAATDFTLRCCGRELQRQSVGSGGEAAGAAVAGAEAAGGGAPAAAEQGTAGAAAAGGGAAAAAAAAVPRGGLRGLAVATCCHHRCSWRHYVGQAAFRAAGLSPEEFEVVSWMTGWALCGHEAPAGFGAGAAEGSDMEEDEPGPPAPAAAAAAVAQGTAGGAAGAAGAAPVAPAAAAVGTSRGDGPEGSAGQGPAKRPHRESAQPAAAGGAAGGAAAGKGAGSGGEEAWGPWRPYHSLPRAERIAVGQKCKRLIDAGRLAWLREQGFQASGQGGRGMAVCGRAKQKNAGAVGALGAWLELGACPRHCSAAATQAAAASVRAAGSRGGIRAGRGVRREPAAACERAGAIAWTGFHPPRSRFLSMRCVPSYTFILHTTSEAMFCSHLDSLRKHVVISL